MKILLLYGYLKSVIFISLSLILLGVLLSCLDFDRDKKIKDRIELIQDDTFSLVRFKDCDSNSLKSVVRQFQKSIREKDSIGFDSLFFTNSVAFTGIMSKKSESDIKKNFEQFEGLSISNHRKFISEIIKTPKIQEEEINNLTMSTDGFIANISFDYIYKSGDKVIQWGREFWNLVYWDDKWQITDVNYSIHLAGIEGFPDF